MLKANVFSGIDSPSRCSFEILQTGLRAQSIQPNHPNLAEFSRSLEFSLSLEQEARKSSYPPRSPQSLAVN